MSSPDQLIWNYMGDVLIYGGFGYLLYRALKRAGVRFDLSNWRRFIPITCIGLVLLCLQGWGYFADRGMFLAWPLFIGIIVIVLLFVRAADIDRKARERADELRQFPDPPNLGGPAEKDDFKDW